MQKKKRRAATISVLPMYIFTIAFVLGPLIYMLVLSFFTKSDQWGATADLTLNNYARIAEPLYLKTFWNSTKLAFISTVAVLLIGYPFGYFMSRLTKKWRTLCMLLLIIPFWTNALMRLYGWIIFFRANGVLDTFLMWLGVTSQPLKLLYTYPSVVTGMVYVLVPFMIYAVYSSAEKIDWHLVEAARDLGATRFTAFRTVTLPLTLPGVFSGVVLTFVPSMGLYFIADILGGNKTILVGNLIYDQLMKVRDWPFAAAISVALLLLTSVFLLAYRLITKSDLEGLV